MSTNREIPVAHTPAGGYGERMPPPVLAGCRDPLIDGAPDLRGMWRTVDASNLDGPLPPDSPMWGHVERIEQAWDRVVITSGGVVHDMRCDGTFEHGVNDVTGEHFDEPVTIAASFEDGILVLRPLGMPGVEVMRWREGSQLIWSYRALFTTRMERIEDADEIAVLEQVPELPPEPVAEFQPVDDGDRPPLIRPGQWTRRHDRR